MNLKKRWKQQIACVQDMPLEQLSIVEADIDIFLGMNGIDGGA